MGRTQKSEKNHTKKNNTKITLRESYIMTFHLDDDPPYTVGFNYKDEQGQNHFFVIRTEKTNTLMDKLKDYFDLPPEVNWIECSQESGDPNSRWHLDATYNCFDDEGEITTFVDHSPDRPEEEVRATLERFMLDPDLLGFYPKAGDFPKVHTNKDLHRLSEVLHQRFVCQSDI